VDKNMRIREIDIKKIWVIGIVINLLLFIIFCSNKSDYGIAADSTLDAASAKQITITRQITLGVNSQDTLWMPLNESIFPSNGVSNDPPDYSGWNGNGRFYLRRVSGNTSDSIAVLLKPCSHLGTIFKTTTDSTLDSLFVFGTSFTNYVNIGSGSTYMRSISGIFDPTMQIAAIIKQGDLSGGSRVYELTIVKQ
jgi:hypothetical protein